MLKKLLILPFIAAVLVLAGCEAQKNNNAAVESAIAEAKAGVQMMRWRNLAHYSTQENY